MRQIQIVVDDTPAPIGPPMEVLRTPEGEATPPAAAATPEPEPIAPIRPPAGLVRVLAMPLPLETADLEPVRPPRAAPDPAPVAEARKPEVRKAESRRAEPAKAEVKKADAKKLEAKTVRAAKDSLRTAEAGKAKATAETKVAKAKTDGGKASKAKLAKAEGKTKLAKAETSKDENGRKAREKVQLAKAEQTQAAEAEARKPGRLAAVVKKAIHTTPKAEVAEISGKLRLAEARKAEKAKARTDKAKAEKAEAAPARKAPQAVKGAGPLRMVSNRCASTDPAAALVCADPSLGAADRRLNRAYRQAEAAGVSAGELRRQQQRWLVARAAAAREAPWAVQDVYQARIAELEDMTRGQDGGF
jgi:uncharacterized protein YecT (DUF1311 family)